MKLHSLPRLPFAALPTPLQPAIRLSAALGGPQIWFKRDDLTGFGLGGNKVRKLEFLAADAVAKGADTLITGAGTQSNHVRTTMAVAAHLGLQGVAVFHGSRPHETQGNLLLDELLGAKIVFTDNPDRSQLDDRIIAEGEKLRSEGRTPYVINRGGASPLGSSGYVLASLEIFTQLSELRLQPDYLFCATGSCGTQAGLLVGKKWLQLGFQLSGVTVSRSRAECLDRIEDLSYRTADLLELEIKIQPDDIVIYDDYIGKGYGIPTPECIQAVKLVAQTEGIILDPVYTGKMMAGFLDLVKQGQIGPNDTVLLLHTGGAPGLFSHAAAFIE